MKLWQVFERFLQRERLSEGKSIKAVAETVVSAFAIAFIAFGAISYSGDSKKGSVELAGIVRQKASEEQAVICGYGWWQGPSWRIRPGWWIPDRQRRICLILWNWFMRNPIRVRGYIG